MTKWVVVVLILAVLAGGLLWQAGQKGKLKAQNHQLVVTVEELVKAEKEQKARAEKLDDINAVAALRIQKLSSETNELREKLKTSSECDAGYFSDEFINRVLEYRGEAGANLRAGS